MISRLRSNGFITKAWLLLLIGLKRRWFQELESESQKAYFFRETVLPLLNLYPCLLFVLFFSFPFSLVCCIVFTDECLVLGLVICSEQVQDVVLSADIGCAECQKRVAEIMSRMNGKFQQVLLHLRYCPLLRICSLSLFTFSLFKGITKPKGYD